MAKRNKTYDFETPTCPKCGVRKLTRIQNSPKDGRPIFRKICRTCAGMAQISAPQLKYREAVYRKLATLTCEKCGFKAQDKCQLDVDHIDGNHDNNDPSNHQILCANCHRLKTLLNKDGLYHKKGIMQKRDN